MNPKNLLNNIRFYILTTSIMLSGLIYLTIILTTPPGSTQLVKFVEIYALISILFLYLTLLAGPFCYSFQWFPFRSEYLKARRALGVSSFYFALLHVCFSFFGQLGGFVGLSFLDNKYLLAVSIGFVALLIMSLLAITSFDLAVSKLTFPRWKFLHRFVYLAAILVLVHAVMLGSHFNNLSDVIPQITFASLTFLLLLEAPRMDKVLRRFIPIPSFGLSFTLIAVIMAVIFFTMINPLFTISNGTISFDIHASHRQLAQQALQQSQTSFNGINPNNVPGLNGDRNKRYTVSFTSDPINPQPNQPVSLHFKVYDASSGNPVRFFRILYAKPMHLIIVNSPLTYFDHIHPDQNEQDFSITTQFSAPDIYHLYIQFQPFGGIEQQSAFTLPVGQVPNPVIYSKARPDKTTTKTFGNYSVSIDTQATLNASQMSAGLQKISFTVKDAKTGKPITTLKPFLGAFGHLTMINEESFDFIHVHPFSLTAPPPNANGGPTVDFLPIGIYGPFKPGIYRAFAEFSTKIGEDFDTDFTVKVE